MKKLLILLSFLIAIVAACAPASSGNKKSMSSAKRPMESRSMAMVSEADITVIDSAIWDVIKRKDYAVLEKMLASDYIEVQADGVYNKLGIMAYVKDLDISELAFSDRKMFRIDEDTVMLTYNVNVKGTLKGQVLPAGPYRAAAAYVNRGQWLKIYYQQTMSRTAPSPALPMANPSARTAESPMSKLTQTGPDAVANEKLVWNALKSGNYDAFASYLAPEAIEIEADGMYDKAGSVKGASMLSAFKVELSEWRTVKLDNDASLVTYLVRLPGINPNQERHTTIWANRDGKWLALFHMGTPTNTPPGERTLITGVVKAADGSLLPNANVKAVKLGEHFNSSTSTNSSGKYILELVPGKYQITASASGYLPAQKQDNLPDAGDKHEINFELRKKPN